MLEKMKDALSKMTVIAAAYMPGALKESLLQMATEIDRLRAEIDVLKNGQVK